MARPAAARRPLPVRLFEYASIAALLFSLPYPVSHWNRLDELDSPVRVIGTLLLLTALVLWLTLAVSRRRSRKALWGLILLYAVGLVGTWWDLEHMRNMMPSRIFAASALAQAALQCFALALLLLPSARRWLK